MISLHKLEVFNTVAIEGNFSRAAKRLLLSQPAVSQHIRDLERHLGTELFHRSSQGAILTPAGETLHEYTRSILQMLVEAENAVVTLNQATQNQLILGATPGASVYLLPGWIQSFHRHYPGISANVRTDTTGMLASNIAAGKIELGFVEGELLPEPHLNILPLREIELYVAVGAGHPWWEAPNVSIPELDGQAFIARSPGSHTRAWTDQLFARHGVTPHRVAEFDNPESIKQAVAAGMGISILPDWVYGGSEAQVRGVPIQGFDLRRTLKLLWSEAIPLKTIPRAFLVSLADEFPILERFRVQSEDRFASQRDR